MLLHFLITIIKNEYTLSLGRLITILGTTSQVLTLIAQFQTFVVKKPCFLQTLHKVMKTLIFKGLVKLIADELDGRVKYLEPTPRAIKVFNEIGKEMK